VEVLFFRKGQEPDLALLGEDPKASELYLPEVFEREEIPPRPGGARAHCRVVVAYPGASSKNACRIDDQSGRYDETLGAAPRIEFLDVPRGAVLSMSETTESGEVFSEVPVRFLLPEGTLDKNESRAGNQSLELQGEKSLEFLDYPLEEICR
jgi:hypothetical protein